VPAVGLHAVPHAKGHMRRIEADGSVSRKINRKTKSWRYRRDSTAFLEGAACNCHSDGVWLVQKVSLLAGNVSIRDRHAPQYEWSHVQMPCAAVENKQPCVQCMERAHSDHQHPVCTTAIVPVSANCSHRFMS
jgi:hypothetical protein